MLIWLGLLVVASSMIAFGPWETFRLVLEVYSLAMACLLCIYFTNEIYLNPQGVPFCYAIGLQTHLLVPLYFHALLTEFMRGPTLVHWIQSQLST